MKRIDELMSTLKEVKEELEKKAPKVAPEGSNNRETYVDNFEKVNGATPPPPPPPPPPTLGQMATAGGTKTINSQIGNPFGKKEHMKVEKNGQWKLDKLEDSDLPEEKPHEFDQDHTAKLLRPHPSGNPSGIMPIPAGSAKPDISSDKTKTIGKAEDKPAKGHSSFTMEHVHHVSGMKDHAEARNYAHSVVESSTANADNKAKMKNMINRSKNPRHLAQGMSNHILAHPGEGLKVVK